MRPKSKFSCSTVMLWTACHFTLTYVLAFVIFITAMGSFTHSVSEKMAFWNVILWLWTPLARWYFQSDGDQIGQMKLLAFAWSFLVGLMAAWLRRYFQTPHRG